MEQFRYDRRAPRTVPAPNPTRLRVPLMVVAAAAVMVAMAVGRFLVR